MVASVLMPKTLCTWVSQSCYIHTLFHIPTLLRGQFITPNPFPSTFMFLGGKRKSDNLEEIHVVTGRTCKTPYSFVCISLQFGLICITTDYLTKCTHPSNHNCHNRHSLRNHSTCSIRTAVFLCVWTILREARSERLFLHIVIHTVHPLTASRL